MTPNTGKLEGESARELVGRLRREPHRPIDMQAIREIIDRVAALPVLDDRTPEEIIGYDENGVPI